MSIIDSQRASLRAEIASLEARLLVLRSQLNSLSTINCLPTDITLEVFRLVRGAPISNFGWIQGITDICSHWRSVVLGQRELWTTVFLSPKHVKQQEPIFTLLNRAEGSPLTLYAPSSSFLVGDKGMEPFGIHPHALRGLFILTCLSLKHLSQFFRVEDNIEAPWLQTLNIDFCTGKAGAMPEFVKFLSEQCLSLQTLRIPSLFFVSTDLQALNLSQLSLFETSIMATPDSHHERLFPYDVLASLTHCTNLRFLAIAGPYLEYYEQFLPSVKLTLPFLSSVKLAKTKIRSVINVLQFISSPMAVDVSCLQITMVPTFLPLDREKPTPELVSELVKIMLEHCRSQGSHLFLYDFLGESDPYNYGFRLEESLRSILDISLVSGSEYPADLYSALLAPLNPTSFTRISLQGIALNVVNLPFFCVCPATSVTVIPRGNFHVFKLATPPGVTDIPLPHLKNIEIFYVYGNDLLLITSTLWWRCRKGLPLPRLTLVGTDEESRFNETARRLLPLITNGTFLKDSSGDERQLPHLDFENIPNLNTAETCSKLDVETGADQDTDEYDSEESELSNEYGAWFLRPDEALLEDEESDDDYVPTESDQDPDSDSE
ncbi:hypothetical protein DL96DRAFT_1751745 [Flagelloscypha sp. PMI_526]|nr:hypothetical protein DL96DRAFT_1751745 [Flagelloscypha sp. PMI_526]